MNKKVFEQAQALRCRTKKGMVTDMTEDEFRRSLPLFINCTGAVIGVSGGPDSMALLTMFIKARDEGKITFPFICATLNHGLRAEATAEVEGVRKYCMDRSVMFETEYTDIPSEIPQGESTENYARQRRYAFFDRIKAKYGYSHLVTAHNADDNLETVLMNILRGCGTDGLCGISRLRKDNNTVRPLLSVTKAELTAYCEDNNVPYYIDMSNFDTAYRRNFIRNKVEPLLRELNPSVTDAVNRLCFSASEDCDFLNTEADKAYSGALINGALSLNKARQLSPALLNRVLRLYTVFATGKTPTFADTAHLRELLLNGQTSDSCIINGKTFRLTYTALTAEEERKSTFTPLVPNIGENRTDEWLLTLRNGTGYSGQRNCFRPVSMNNALIRPRKEGDYMHTPQGSGKLLKKLYTDKKIPSDIRPSLPVLVIDGVIVWAAMIGTAKEFLPNRGGSYIQAEFTLH